MGVEAVEGRLRPSSALFPDGNCLFRDKRCSPTRRSRWDGNGRIGNKPSGSKDWGRAHVRRIASRDIAGWASYFQPACEPGKRRSLGGNLIMLSTVMERDVGPFG
jgi:hypothetical protein